MALSIGELARRTATKVQTIRYYEQIGLLPEPDRNSGNQRRYGGASLQRLAFVRHGRELGFSLEAIRDLIQLSEEPSRSCAEADLIARKHLAEVESRIERLTALKKELQRMITTCAGGTVSACRVMETLADHRLCAGKSHSAIQPGKTS
jgi:DNA-binding transcriptional MerR regulator